MEQWLDPKLLNETDLQGNGEAIEEGVSASPVLNLQDADNAAGGSLQEENTEEAMGAWSL